MSRGLIHAPNTARYVGVKRELLVTCSHCKDCLFVLECHDGTIEQHPKVRAVKHEEETVLYHTPCGHQLSVWRSQ